MLHEQLIKYTIMSLSVKEEESASEEEAPAGMQERRKQEKSRHPLLPLL
jgi:hypothetical protein